MSESGPSTSAEAARNCDAAVDCEMQPIGEPTLADSHEHKPKCTWPITLTKEYTQWANQQALTQLGKAGFRLAALLRAIFENH
jgi:hypothetical protein